jgi:hypothetical protein
VGFLVATWGFVKRNAVALVSAAAGLLLQWWFLRPKPSPTADAHQTDRSLGALAQKAKDEQQAAAEVPTAAWPTGDKSAVISELKKDGVIK